MTEVGVGSKTITCCLVLCRSGRSKQVFFLSFRISITSVLYLPWLFVHVHLKTRGLMLIGQACWHSLLRRTFSLRCCVVVKGTPWIIVSATTVSSLFVCVCVCVSRTAQWVAFRDARHEFNHCCQPSVAVSGLLKYDIIMNEELSARWRQLCLICHCECGTLRASLFCFFFPFSSRLKIAIHVCLRHWDKPVFLFLGVISPKIVLSCFCY